MFVEIMNWFDSITFFYILVVSFGLFILEYSLIFLSVDKRNVKRLMLNLWPVLGVFTPGLWLLRNVENGFQVTILLVIIAFYGLYKPTKTKVNKRGQ